MGLQKITDSGFSVSSAWVHVACDLPYIANTSQVGLGVVFTLPTAFCGTTTLPHAALPSHRRMCHWRMPSSTPRRALPSAGGRALGGSRTPRPCGTPRRHMCRAGRVWAVHVLGIPRRPATLFFLTRIRQPARSKVFCLPHRRKKI